MKKQVVDMVRNYVKTLSDTDFFWLYSRLNDRLGGDIGEAVNLLSKSEHLDKWLNNAENANELYDMVDFVLTMLKKDDRLSSSLASK